MTRPHAAPVVILAAMLAGCGGDHGIEGDATDTAADEAHDTAIDDIRPDDPPADTTIPDGDCTEEIHWITAPRMIESVTLVDGIARMGVTERLLVAVQLQSGCESLAGIEVSVSPGGATDLIEMAASGWMPVGMDCPPVAPIVERVVAIPGREQGNLHVVVTDLNSPGGGLRLTYDREACSGIPECMCGPSTPPGDGAEWADCVTDCSCAEGLSCIGYFGIGGPLWSCVQACSDFRDCDPRETCLPLILDGAPYVCSHGVDSCEVDGDCPPGFVCTHTGVASFCEDMRAGPLDRPCTCDADCPEGHLCVGPDPACEIPCLSDAWCPEAPIESPVCTERFVCEHSG